MRRIAVINQKGGVGKTTTTVNLGAALARLGERVLVGDLDAQCNLTVHLDVDPASQEPSLYEVFHGKASLADVVRGTRQPRLDVAPASIDLAGVELELVNAVGREVILRDAFDQLQAEQPDAYDYLLLDCPPSLGLVSLNALVACDELIVPIQAEFFALQGLGKLLEIVEVVKRRLNPNLRIAAMVSCRHDPTTKLGKAVIGDIRDHFGEILLETVIRRNVKLAEAPSHGCTIFDYDAECRGARDYLSLARELVGENDGEASASGPTDEEVVEAVQALANESSGSPPAPPEPTDTPHDELAAPPAADEPAEPDTTGVSPEPLPEPPARSPDSPPAWEPPPRVDQDVERETAAGDDAG